MIVVGSSILHRCIEGKRCHDITGPRARPTTIAGMISQVVTRQGLLQCRALERGAVCWLNIRGKLLRKEEIDQGGASGI